MTSKEIDKLIKQLETERQLKTAQRLKDINYRQNLINEKNELIEKINFEKTLIINNLVDNIKNLNSSEISLIWGASSQYFRDAWKYFHYKDKEKDEETKKKWKRSYEFVITKINSDILLDNKDFKLKNILYCGYDNSQFSFEYTYKKQVFEISIPMFDNTTLDNYKEMLLGYRVYIQTSESSWSLIIKDLDPNIVAQKLKEYIKGDEDDK